MYYKSVVKKNVLTTKKISLTCENRPKNGKSAKEIKKKIFRAKS